MSTPLKMNSNTNPMEVEPPPEELLSRSKTLDEDTSSTEVELPPQEPLSRSKTLDEDPSFYFEEALEEPTPSTFRKTLRRTTTGVSSIGKPIEPDETPEPLRKEGISRFRYTKFTVYRRVFALVFTLNAISLMVLMICTHGSPSAVAVNSASSANLLATILSRQENFVNVLYEVVCCAPHSLPLAVRCRLANVFQYGGAHSGCGTSAAMWFLLETILVTIRFANHHTSLKLANMITSWFIIVFLITVILAAHPKFRRLYHDRFEMLHRFSGWSALGFFWAHLFIVVAEDQSDDHSPYKQNYGIRLISTPSFWLLLASSACTVLSWSRLRLHKVYPEVLSEHATRLHFKYTDMNPFYGVKLSTRPATEWHAFATIPNPGPKGSGFSVLVSNAGDWTDNIIKHPPQKLWIRGYPLHGVLYTSRLFKCAVVVATGTGIGPTLSMFAARKTPVRILWSTPNPKVTFGRRIIDEVKAADPNAIIWNSRKHGRPDLIAVTCQLVSESGAEAVFCISNPKVTWNVILEMNRRKISAYGAIFDS